MENLEPNVPNVPVANRPKRAAQCVDDKVLELVSSYTVPTSAGGGTVRCVRASAPVIGGGSSDAAFLCVLTDTAAHILSCDAHYDPSPVARPIQLKDGPVCAVWSRDATCVVVGDNAGALHFVSSSGALLFSQRPPGTNVAFVDIAFLCDGSNMEQLLLLCGNDEGGRGPQLLRFTNMDMSAMLRAATTGDVEGLKTVRSSIGFSRVGLDTVHDVVYGFDVASDAGIVAICGEGACAATVWQREASPSDPEHGGAAEGNARASELSQIGHLASTAVRCGKEVVLGLHGSTMGLVSADGSLSIWSVPSFEQLATLPNHHHVQNVVALSAPPTDTVSDPSWSFCAAFAACTGVSDQDPTSLSSSLCYCCVQEENVNEDGTSHAHVRALQKGEHMHEAKLVGVTVASAPKRFYAVVLDDNAMEDNKRPLESPARVASTKQLKLQLYSTTTADGAMTGTCEHTEATNASAPPQPPTIQSAHPQLSTEERATQAHGIKLMKMLTSWRPSGAADTDESGSKLGALLQELQAVLDSDLSPSTRVAAVTACLNARMSTTSAMRQLLHTLHAGREHLTLTSAGSTDRLRSSVIAQAQRCAELVDRTCYRFDTWELCFHGVGNEQRDGGQHDDCGKETQDHYSWDFSHWSRFQHADGAAMAHNLGTLLARGAIGRAVLFWQRHAHRDTAVRDCIADILPLLPTSVAPLQFVPWLLDEVLPHLHAEQRRKVEDWLCQRAQFIESDDGSPHRAFELVCLSLGFNATSTNGGSTSEFSCSSAGTPLGSMAARVDAFITPTFGMDEDGTVETGSTEDVRLVDLYQRLRQLTYLWDGPQIEMGLFEFTEASPLGVAMAMIERAADIDELNNEIALQITPFVQQAGLTPDNVFCEFVKQVGQALRGDDALQIMRSMAIIPHIGRVSLRLEAVLALLRGSEAPHSKDLWSLADNALVWAKRAANKSCVEQLEEQKRFMQLQEILHRYDAQGVDLSDREQVTRLHRHVLSRTERSEALTDAMQLAGAYTYLSDHSTHVVYLQNLVSGTRSSVCNSSDNADSDAISAISARVVAVLDAMEITPAILVGEEVLHFSFALLCDIEVEQRERVGDTMNAEDGDIDQMRARRVLDAAEAIVARLAERSSPVSAHSTSLATSTTTLAELRRLKQIRANFGLIISLATLHDSECCEQLITRRIRVQLDSWCDQMQRSIDAENVVGHMEQRDPSANATQERHSNHLSFWEMVRLAGFLGFDRSRLLGMTAVEAAVVGNVEVAVKCCTELYKRVPSEQTGQLISRVAMKMLQFVDANAADIFSGEDVDAARTPIVSTALLQMSSVTCAEESLALVMDLYSIMDTVGLAVSQTEMGDYATLLDNAGTDEGDSGVDNGTAAVPSPSMMTLSHVQKLMPDRHMHVEWLDSDSVVLQTAPVMQLATRFAVGECGRLLSLSQAADYSHLEYASRGLHEHVAKHGAYQLSLRVLATSAHFDNIESRTGLEEQRQQLASLLGRVLQSHNVDYSLALGCMMALPIEMAVLTFREQLKREQTHREFKRLQRLGRLGVNVGRQCREAPPSFRQACAQLAINAHWWDVLSKLHIKFEYKTFDAAAAAQDPKSGLRKLVRPLLAKTKYDLVAAKEFCAHYELDDPSLTCVEMLLLLPAGNRPQYRDEIEAVLRNGAVRRDSEQLADMLDQVIQRLDATDYEKLLFTLELLRAARGGARPAQQSPECGRISRHIQVLQVLLTYYQQGEERRIDFHRLTQDPWKVICPELNTESVVKLVALATPLGISRDDFYVELVRSMFRDAGDQAAQAEASAAQAHIVAGATASTRLPDMEEIAPLLQACRPPAATVCAEEVAEHYADGANKLAALELAVQCAQRWSEGELDDDASCVTPGAEASPRERGPGGAERVPSGAACGAQRVCTGKATLRRLTKMAAMAFTALQLSAVKWLLGDAGVAQMLKIGNPHLMIQQLYERFSVAAYKAERCQRGGFGHNGPRSLHSVIEAIALRHEIDVSRLKRKLLNEWLAADTGCATGTSSPTDSLDVRSCGDAPCIFELSAQERASSVDSNLAIRIVYILSRPVERNRAAAPPGAADDASSTSAADATTAAQVKGAITLLQFAKKSAKVTYAGRLRALRALFLLAPKSVIERVHKDMCDEQLDDLMRFWKLCFFMSECDALRLGIHTMEEFESRDKRELVQGLWRNHRQRSSQSGRVMRLVVALMVDHAIHDVKLWGAVLRQLQDQGEHRFLLLHALPTVAGSATLCRHLGAGLSSLWQKIVMQPLEELEVAVQQHEKVFSATTGDVSTGPNWASNIDSVLSQVVVLLHRCPFVSRLDIASLAARLASTGGGRFVTHALKIAHAIPEREQRDAMSDRIRKQQQQQQQ